MDNMLEHPGNELQLIIKEKGLTQKAFASILGKKVSEVNELLKGKRNITIQRDYLLHQTLGTPIKYWILKQVDYDYSLIDIEDYKSPPSVRGDAPEELGGFSLDDTTPSISEESIQIVRPFQGELPKAEGLSQNDESSGASAKDLKGETNKINSQDSSSLHSSEGQDKNDEDFKKRARIFKSF